VVEADIIITRKHTDTEITKKKKNASTGIRELDVG